MAKMSTIKDLDFYFKHNTDGQNASLPASISQVTFDAVNREVETQNCCYSPLFQARQAILKLKGNYCAWMEESVSQRNLHPKSGQKT